MSEGEEDIKISKNRLYTYCFQVRHDTSEKKQCKCGGSYSYYAKSKHMKTKRHQRYLETGIPWRALTRAEHMQNYRTRKQARAEAASHKKEE